MRRYVLPPPIRHQYAHTTHAACRTHCTSRRWSITPTTRSACGGSAIGTRRRPRINSRCLPWPARALRDLFAPRGGPFGTSIRWRASRNSVGRTRSLSSELFLDLDCLCFVTHERLQALPGCVLDAAHHVRIDSHIASTDEALGGSEGARGLHQCEGTPRAAQVGCDTLMFTVSARL